MQLGQEAGKTVAASSSTVQAIHILKYIKPIKRLDLAAERLKEDRECMEDANTVEIGLNDGTKRGSWEKTRRRWSDVNNK